MVGAEVIKKWKVKGDEDELRKCKWERREQTKEGEEKSDGGRVEEEWQEERVMHFQQY